MTLTNGMSIPLSLLGSAWIPWPNSKITVKANVSSKRIETRRSGAL